jgi:hypothetical protein
MPAYAANPEIMRQRRLRKWRAVLETVAWGASVSSVAVILGLFGASKAVRHVCDFTFLIFGGAALAIRLVASRQ